MKKIIYALALATPLCGTTVLRVSLTPARAVSISWPNEEGTTYRILRSVSPTFTPMTVVTNMISQKETGEIIVAATPQQAYYKIEERRNPLHGLSFYIDPNSRAAEQAKLWETSNPSGALQMRKIASQPQAFWLTSSGAKDIVAKVSGAAKLVNATPIFSAYYIPKRDCNSYSGGGARTPEDYLAWCTNIWTAMTTKAVTVLEPDSLALISSSCLTPSEQTTRYDLIRQAGLILRREGRSKVYLDGGHSRWHSASEMASRLKKAGIENVDGFALNVSNFQTTSDCIAYGTAISKLLNDVHFIIDTSRNGLGPSPDANLSWCNRPGRALGMRPTTRTDHPLVDAFLWIKKPGESDGNCRPGEPTAGAWWPEYAVGLAERAAY